MSVKHEFAVQPSRKTARQGRNEFFNRSAGRFPDSALMPRPESPAHFHIRTDFVRPHPVDTPATARAWKANQPHRRGLPLLRKNHPVVIHRAHSVFGRYLTVMHVPGQAETRGFACLSGKYIGNFDLCWIGAKSPGILVRRWQT